MKFHRFKSFLIFTVHFLRKYLVCSGLVMVLVCLDIKKRKINDGSVIGTYFVD